MDQNVMWQIVAGLIPSIGVFWLFYKIIKALIEADRNERKAQREWEAQETDTGAAAPAQSNTGS